MKTQNKRQPPKWSLRLLQWFCPAHILEGIEGDLLEDFDKDMATSGPVIARRKFNVKVISFFRPGIILRN